MFCSLFSSFFCFYYLLCGHTVVFYYGEGGLAIFLNRISKGNLKYDLTLQREYFPLVYSWSRLCYWNIIAKVQWCCVCARVWHEDLFMFMWRTLRALQQVVLHTLDDFIIIMTWYGTFERLNKVKSWRYNMLKHIIVRVCSKIKDEKWLISAVCFSFYNLKLVDRP